VVGRAYIATGERHAFLWGDGVMIDLGTPGGFQSEADDTNGLGQVVGCANNADQRDRAALWTSVY
jgi:probable HAF family extracellular repeat protein